MIAVLLVDDDEKKAQQVVSTIETIGLDLDIQVARARSVTEATTKLREHPFDLMIVDLQLPMRPGQDPVPEGGVRLMQAISQKGARLTTPTHIVGLTAFAELESSTKPFFDEGLWHLVRYESSSDEWVRQIGRKIIHIAETQTEKVLTGYQTDLAIVTALTSVELEAVLSLPGGWEREERVGDETLYHLGSFKRGTSSLSVVAASAREMGMPAMAALCMKTIYEFRPRYITMSGIAAGLKGNYGDILIATHSWDYGSGKTRHAKGKSAFMPSPSQIQMSALLKSKLALFSGDQSIFRRIQQSWNGIPTPMTTLDYKMGPMASGASVVESRPLIEEIKSHNAKVVGVEMEMYGMFMAAESAGGPRPSAFGVKSVCDFADTNKNDEYQKYAGYTSANFIYEFALSELATRAS
jgi:nucleoside phosphorylase/CheY-like chemotaxis protein